jgi:hypothetical protein
VERIRRRFLAIALARAATLVTHHTKDGAQILGLRLTDWTE